MIGRALTLLLALSLPVLAQSAGELMARGDALNAKNKH